MSPSRTAVVESRWVLEPASGSVIANAIFSPVAERGEPLLLLLVGPEAGDQLGADRRRHEEQQERAPLRGELLGHDGELADAAPAAAVLGWEVHREEAVVGDRLPERLGLAAGPDLLGEVLVAELGREVADRGPDHLVLGALGEVHRPAPEAANVIRR